MNTLFPYTTLFRSCGEPALALEVADTIPLSEQRSILLCILRDYTYRRNAFWKELLDIPWE